MEPVDDQLLALLQWPRGGSTRCGSDRIDSQPCWSWSNRALHFQVGGGARRRVKRGRRMYWSDRIGGIRSLYTSMRWRGLAVRPGTLRPQSRLKTSFDTFPRRGNTRRVSDCQWRGLVAKLLGEPHAFARISELNLRGSFGRCGRGVGVGAGSTLAVRWAWPRGNTAGFPSAGLFRFRRPCCWRFADWAWLKTTGWRPPGVARSPMRASE